MTEKLTYRIFRDLEEAKKWESGAYREWARGLTEAQLEAINHYVGTGYLQINGALRGHPECLTEDSKVPTETALYIERLDSAVSCRPKESVILYRGFYSNVINIAWAAFSGDITGFEFENDGYTSTSLDPTVAEQFRRDYGIHAVYAEIRFPPNFPSASIEHAVGTWEDEILLSRGRKFRVVSAIMILGVRRLILEVIG